MKEWLITYSAILADEELSVSTQKKYNHNIRIFLDFCQEGQVNKATVLAFKKDLLEQFKASTANTYIISINRYFAWLGLVELKSKSVKIQRSYHLDHTLNVDEYMKLLSICRNAGDQRSYLLLRTLAGTGIRIGELGCITYEAALAGGTLVQGKGKYRYIFIPQEMAENLLLYCKQNNIASGIIFSGKVPGRTLHPFGVWRILKRIAVDAGVNPEKVYPHNLRHLFAKTYMSKVGTICELADLLGHSSIETTRIYAMTSKQEKLRSLAMLKL